MAKEKVLIIVESPSKIKTIQKYLPKDKEYSVLASVGHIADLSSRFKYNLGINIERLESGAVKLRQRKLLGALFDEYPPSGRKVNQPQRAKRMDANNVNDQDKEPCEQREYLHLLGMLNYIAHSRPDISTALSYAATKNRNHTNEDFNELLLVVDYLW